MKHRTAFIRLNTLILVTLADISVWASTPLHPQSDTVGFDQRLGNRIPTQSRFLDELGREKRLISFLGKKPILLTMAYFKCPGLCSLVLNGVTEAIRSTPLQLGQDFEVITVSINPKDQPRLALSKRRSYLSRYGSARMHDSSPGWHFLTSDETNIHALASSIGFRYQYDPETGEFEHPSGAVVITPNGVVSRYFFGIQFNPHELKLALEEASNESIGSSVDRILLFCSHYNPINSKYGPLVIQLTQKAGAITILMMTVFFILQCRSKKVERTKE